MQEVSTGTDSATVEVIQEAPEFMPTPDGDVVQIPTGQQIALRLLQTFRQLGTAGDQVAVVLINPQLKEEFLAAWKELPDGAFHTDADQAKVMRDNLPLQEDERVKIAEIIPVSHMEKQFLVQHFGPREEGGNGLLPQMEAYLQEQPYPVRITIDWLRNRYLDQIAERFTRRVEVASTMPVLRR